LPDSSVNTLPDHLTLAVTPAKYVRLSNKDCEHQTCDIDTHGEQLVMDDDGVGTPKQSTTTHKVQEAISD
jgi:hypothetical protein